MPAKSGFCRVRGFVFGAAAAIAACVTPGLAGVRVALLEIEGKPRETSGELAWLLGDDHQRTLRAYVDALEGIAGSGDHAGVVVRLKDAELSRGDVDELSAAMRHVREAGKKVHVFAEAYGATDLLLGAGADEVIAQAGAPVELPGLHMEEMFLADTLAWVGVKADMVQIGDYKGASEQMSRSGPSPEWDRNISQLLDSMYANMRATLKEGRKLDDAGLDHAMEDAWMCDAAQARALRLIDSEVDLAMLSEHLGAAYGEEVEWDEDLFGGGDSKVSMPSNPFAMLQMLSKTPDRTVKRDSIGLLHIDGVIVDGDSSAGGFLGGGANVGSRTIRNAIEGALAEDRIKGVVVRIDSPGGSATASEVIWQGLKRLAAKKPVWVSVGDMAASGGYYIAVGGDKIYVDPSSIVGSIGVVGGRYSMQGLYDKLQVKVVTRSRGPKADMFRTTNPWTPGELALVRKKMADTYTLFTKRVSAGRKDIDLAKTAEGRLFTGDKAVDLGMADAVGGLDLCLSELAARLDLEDFDVIEYPAPKSLGETIGEMVGRFAAAGGSEGGNAKAKGGGVPMELVMTLRAAVGPRAWPAVRQSVEGMMQLREQPVVLMAPSTLVFR